MKQQDEKIIPVLEETARVIKHDAPAAKVSVRTITEEYDDVVRDVLKHESVDVQRVAVGREVASAPPVRTEDGVTIVPVLEERLIIEKRLVLKEELHIRRSSVEEPVEAPVTLRRQRVEVERTKAEPEPSASGAMASNTRGDDR